MKCLCSFLTILFLWSATALGQESRPLLIDLASLPHRPLEVTTKPGAKVPAGRVELVDGQFGKACKFSFVESTGPQFFTAWVNPRENWDQYEGFSFWVKGDGSKGCGGLEFIDGNDYALRYGYCFPIESTEWVKIIRAVERLGSRIGRAAGRRRTRLCSQQVSQRVGRQVVLLARVPGLFVHHRADAAGKENRPRHDRLHSPTAGSANGAGQVEGPATGHHRDHG